MSIYIPFTYIIGWSEHKQFYYGAKWAKGCQPSDLWKSYFTSSKQVEEFRKENGEPDIIEIHKTFSDKNSCVLFEHNYLTKIDAKNHPLFLNKSNGDKSFYSDTTGMVTVRDENGKTFWVSINDPRYISGELIHTLKNKEKTKEHIEKLSIAKKGKSQSQYSIEKRRNSLKGKPRPSYIKEKIGKSNTGKSKGMVSCYSIESNSFIKIEKQKFEKGKNITYFAPTSKFIRNKNLR
jgi:hypothetical protein